MQVINPQGVWLRSNAQFPLFDQEANHLFVPNQVVKIRRSDWAKAQTVIEVVDDPLAVAPIISAVKTAGATTPVQPTKKVVSPI